MALLNGGGYAEQVAWPCTLLRHSCPLRILSLQDVLLAMPKGCDHQRRMKAYRALAYLKPLCFMLGKPLLLQAVAEEAHVLSAPSAFSVPEAAGFMETTLTAFLNIFQIGGARSGDSVLIHGGGSGSTALSLWIIWIYASDLIGNAMLVVFGPRMVGNMAALVSALSALSLTALGSLNTSLTRFYYLHGKDHGKAVNE